MKLDNIAKQVYFVAYNEAKLKSHEFVTPEHFLYAALMFETGKEMIWQSGGNISKINEELNGFFTQYMEQHTGDEPSDSFLLMKLFEITAAHALNSAKGEISLGDLLVMLFQLPESFAVYILSQNGVDKLSLLRYISHGTASRRQQNPSAADTSSQSPSGKGVQDTNDLLEKYAVNLTQQAMEGRLDPLIGREDVVERTLQVLSRRLKNNPVHVGDAGVGKTAIVEGLAQQIAAGDVPFALRDAEIYYVDMGSVVAGTKYRGDFEERLIQILDAAAAKANAIIYLDEIHTVVGAGAVSGGAMDATSILKPYLAKGALRFIGSTTFDEYKKHFERDSALTRRFQRIDISEPSVEDTVNILLGIKSRYEGFHNVTYSPEVIRHICHLTGKYMLDRKLPDKAIDVIDEAGAYLRMNAPADQGQTDVKPIPVTKAHVEQIIARMAKIPPNTVSRDDITLLKQLEPMLKKQIFGQDEAVETVVSAIKASRSGLNDGEKPVASLLFVGPTGVGKTEIARQLADILHLELIRFDMSEYQEAHAVARLIGSPPGYVGYDEGGLLTEAIRKTPHGVLLLDEIEKAHPDILNILLQIMDYGCLTDNIGKKADFRNIILIMTSNAGARNMGRRVIGYDDKAMDADAIHKEVEKVFSPEFRNRLDEIVVFRHVDMDMAARIAKKAAGRLSQRLADQGIALRATQKAIDWIARKGLSQAYGAREIIRIVDKEIKKLLVDQVLFGQKPKSGKLTIDIRDGRIMIR